MNWRSRSDCQTHRSRSGSRTDAPRTNVSRKLTWIDTSGNCSCHYLHNSTVSNFNHTKHDSNDTTITMETDPVDNNYYAVIMLCRPSIYSSVRPSAGQIQVCTYISLSQEHEVTKSSFNSVNSFPFNVKNNCYSHFKVKRLNVKITKLEHEMRRN